MICLDSRCDLDFHHVGMQHISSRLPGLVLEALQAHSHANNKARWSHTHAVTNLHFLDKTRPPERGRNIILTHLDKVNKKHVIIKETV